MHKLGEQWTDKGEHLAALTKYYPSAEAGRINSLGSCRGLAFLMDAPGTLVSVDNLGAVHYWRASWQEWGEVLSERLAQHPAFLDEDDPLAARARRAAKTLFSPQPTP